MSHLTFHSHFPTQSIGAIRWAVRLLLLALLSLLIASCTGTTPSEITDLSLLIVGGDQQRGPAGAELPQPLTVKAVGPRGELLHGIVVNFRVTSGGGSVFAGSAVTNRDGRASEYWTLGFDSTPQVLEVRAVSAAGAKEVFGRFTATVTGGGGSARVVSQAGDSQVAPVGTAVALAPAVRVTDTLGRPWMGVPVVFDVLSGGGSISGDTTFTDSAGIAAVGSWTLGPLPGANTLRATAARSGIVGNPVLFSAQGVVVGVQSLSTGSHHTCIVRNGSQSYCWGENSFGELGDGSTTRRTAPTLVSGGVTFVMITTGYDHSCGLTAGGLAYCWGSNIYGQGGDGTGSSHLLPTPVSGGQVFTQLEAGTYQTCGLTAGGVGWCWGNNTYGRIGDGTNVNRFAPTRVAGGLSFTAIVSGDNHTCGLVGGGEAWCWGLNNAGQVGDSTSIDRWTPVRVHGGHRFTVLTLGYGDVCGLLADATALCWGLNRSGSLGDGTTVNRSVPTPVVGGQAFRAIVAGGEHVCGTLSDSTLACWGLNRDRLTGSGGGQLGDGTMMDRWVPTPVLGHLTVEQAGAGESHSCALTTGGMLYCWGADAFGQLGLPSVHPGSVTVPTVVALP